MSIPSIHARPRVGEYHDAIVTLSVKCRRWSDVTDRDKLDLYELLMRDTPGDAWSALINHDDDRGESGSALVMIRQALFAQPPCDTFSASSVAAAVRAIKRFEQNLSDYFDERIRTDLQDEWATSRTSDRREFEMADYRARVRESAI